MSNFKRFKLHTAFLLAGVFLVTGCMVGPDFKEPAIEDLPLEFRFGDTQPEEIVNLQWWELFNDPVLDYLVESALYENKDLLIAVSRMEEARAFLGLTIPDGLPRLDLEGGINRGNFGGGVLSDDPNNIAFITPVVN